MKRTPRTVPITPGGKAERIKLPEEMLDQIVRRLLGITAELLASEGEFKQVDAAWVERYVQLGGSKRAKGKGEFR